MKSGAISMDQIVALIAVALMLMLASRNLSRFRLNGSRRMGMALIWLVIFGLIALIAAQFGM